MIIIYIDNKTICQVSGRLNEFEFSYDVILLNAYHDNVPIIRKSFINATVQYAVDFQRSECVLTSFQF